MFKISKKREECLIKNGFTKEQIKEMFCTKCGGFGFECTCPMTEEELETERFIVAENMFGY